MRVSLPSDSETIPPLKYDGLLKELLERYNTESPIFSNDPVSLCHVTDINLRSRVRVRNSAAGLERVREDIWVVSLLKSHPSCQECRERGRCGIELVASRTA
jgi:hypothetical protein